jgi:4-hydroxythreonine-4-phosphate dehydrogenase
MQAAAHAAGIPLKVVRVARPSEALTVFDEHLPVLQINEPEPPYAPGNPNEAGARLALGSLEAAVRLARDGAASAVMTSPVNKAQLAIVGFTHPGQTEFVAERCGVTANDAVMMLAGPTLRTVPLTVHCALAEVPRLVTAELLQRRTRIAARALHRDFGIARPRIAVAALNPHAGEGGRFGTEDHRIIAPAVVALRDEGFDVTGPHAADALFTPRSRQRFDLAICMYHDQALIPLKALDFDEGVNVTLGLPIVRTSPDHGTAFDIAGRGVADPGAMAAAIRMAGECAARRVAG